MVPAHVQNLLDRLEKPRETRDGWESCCPAHDDKNPSLSIGIGQDAQVLLNCHAGCGFGDIVSALGLDERDMWPESNYSEPDGVYQYCDAQGNEVYQVVRLPGKNFRARHRNGVGWNWSIGGIERVLYNYPDVVKAIETGDPVFVLEGEKDCDNARTRLNLTATCNTFGAGKWNSSYSAALANAHVAVVPDNDQTGRDHAEEVAASVLRVATSVKIVQLPGLPEKGDTSDWIQGGGTRDKLLELYEAAPDYAVGDTTEAGNGCFWHLDGAKVKIHRDKLLQYLGAEGFTKDYLGGQDTSTLLRITNMVVEQWSAEQIKDYVFDYVDSLPEKLEDGVTRDKIRQALQNTAHLYLSRKTGLECLRRTVLNLVESTRGKAYFFYRNGAVVVTKKGFELKPFESVSGHIWKDWIIDRDFHPAHGESVISMFMRKVCRGNNERLRALASAIGHLLHPYKDPEQAKAIIFVDEEVSDDPSGRSGKTLVTMAISHITPTIIEDAKGFKPGSQFAFQSVEFGTRVVAFDDASKKFPFERCFSIITGRWTIEQKNKQKFYLDFKDAPKVLITTNYMIEGQGGSHEDRVFEIEFSDHYDQYHRPSDDFDGLFFESWDEEEWRRFDNAMMQTVQVYAAVGLTGYAHINLEKRKLRQLTDTDFAEWILDDPPELGADHPKSDLYKSFVKEFPDHQHTGDSARGTSRNQFTRWLKTWGKLESYKIIEERHGDGRERCIRFEERENG